jgi:putative DNA primase/helicase
MSIVSSERTKTMHNIIPKPDKASNVVLFGAALTTGRAVLGEPSVRPSSCLDAALGYVSKYGWKIFPARMEGGKKYSWLSAEHAPGHERWGQTDDLKQLRRNFSNRKWRLICGVGVPTGEENGVFVIEGDTKKGHGVDGLRSLRELETAHGKLPPTLMAESPSGSVHRYYKHPGPGIKVSKPASALAPGVDIKGDAGMVVAPPSVREDGAYRWLNDLPIADAPDWLLAEVTEKSREQPSDPFEKHARELKLEAPIERVAAALAVIPRNDDDPHEKDYWEKTGQTPGHGYMAYIGMATKGATGGGNDGFALFAQWRSGAPDYYADTVMKKWLGFHPTDVGFGTLHYLATAASPGWETTEASVSSKTKLMQTSAAVERVRAADVKMRQKEWLWKGHLLRGALELLTGLPGLGKSQTQIHYMACATAGLAWPDGAPACEPMNVIMVTAEDAIDTEVVPRLKAAGADLTRIHILKYIRIDKQKRQFLLADDLVKLEAAIAQIGNVGLVCIDPITAYMGGKMDSHKATEVRSQLSPLKDFAERTNVAVSAITHPAKNASARAIDHFIGSQAFIAAARVGHACFEEFEEDDEGGEKTPTGRILFTNVKYSEHTKMPTLAYKIESIIIYPEPFLQIETSCVVWDKESVNISAEEAIAATKNVAKAKEKEEGAASEVVDFLRSMIDVAGGWCKQTEIAAQAKALGFTDKELRTARKHLCIVSKKDGFDGPWLWGWEGKRPLRF